MGLCILINESDHSASSNENFTPLVELVGVFDAKYFSENELSEEERNEFSKDSVGYHVWPYWREYAQSSCARIGLSPVLEVPVYFMPFNNKDA